MDTGYGTDGVSRTAFNFILYAEVAKIFIQPDGKYLLCGNYGLAKHYSAARFNASGGLDSSFGTGGMAVIALTGVQEKAMDIEMQPDGKIIFAGDVGTSNTDFSMGRMNADGSLDTTFGSGGWVTVFNDPNFSTFHVVALSLLDDGKILTGGYILTTPNNRADFAVLRFNANGTLDSARLAAAGRSLKTKTGGLPLLQTESVFPGLWGSGGLATAGTFNGNENITSMAVDSVGRVVAAGHSAVPQIGNTTTSEVAMARFLSDAAPLASIYGTIRTDSGMPIRNVSVVLSDGGLSAPRYALTNQFGLYAFTDLPVTESYSVSISSKRFNFTVDQKIISLLHDEESVDFTALP
jgi:uncharacterized delta-60 repeat protein